jgi:hypothetical protein
MTIPPSFPTLPGQGWSVHKKPTFSSIVASHVSGREVRDPLWRYPIWEFEVTFDGLASDANWPGLGSQSLQSLMGLFLKCQGQWGTFLYVDPTDSAVVDQSLGVGDGSTTTFVMARALGGFVEPVGWVTGLSNAKINGALVNTGVALATPNSLVFATAPPPGAIVSASFAYAFVCRFDDDSADFEQFMRNLWAVQSLKFRSVRSA